jgi:hypothetical protein
MITVLEICGLILISIILIIIGYKIAIIAWRPENLLDSLKSANETNEIVNKTNAELIESVKKRDETIASNTNWYLTNINALGQYLKDKHNDNYVFDQLKNIPGIEPKIKKEYDIDALLDKISTDGWTSLTEDEIKYLKDKRENK